MVKRRTTTPSIRLSTREKAELRASLSELLRKATTDSEAAQKALAACLQLGLKVPSVLLTKENVAATLSLQDISRSLGRLSISHTVFDISPALSAILIVGRQQQPDRKILLSISKTVTTRILKIAQPPVRKSRGPFKNEAPKIVFSELTLSSVIDFTLWIVGRLFDPSAMHSKAAYSQALRMVQTVELIWRRLPPPSGGRPAILFLQSLPRILPKAVYAELEDEESIAGFLADAKLALIQEAEDALLGAQIKDLESILALARNEKDNGAHILSHLQSICVSRPSSLLPEAVEWTARQIEKDKAPTKSPIAVDESQSSSLNYVALCLLGAWDAATEGEKAARAFESTRRLARDLFKVELMGELGQIVEYQEREHELSSSGSSVPDRVQLIRPGVRWSDGIRTRFLVRAIVKAAN
jgi:hypothetical protein